MRLYETLQLDPYGLKKKIDASDCARERRYYWFVMALRSALLVAFAVAFISVMTFFFGDSNTPMAVVLFCVLLAFRFVSLEYCIEDSLLTFAVALAILLFAPNLVQGAAPLAVAAIHFTAVFALMLVTSQRPEMGNGGLFGFAYVYLVGNPVSGEAFIQRAEIAVVGYIICAAILFAKHRHAHRGKRFHALVGQFDLRNALHLWQLRMALGVSLVLTAGVVLGVERFMWMGFACSSLLAEYPYSADTSERFCQRVIGAMVGSSAFCLLYILTPVSWHFLLGIAGGFCLGFCTDYRYKTALNCFGALMIGAGLYGIQDAVFLRVTDTVFGVVFALVFAWGFHRFIGGRAASSVPDAVKGLGHCPAGEHK